MKTSCEEKKGNASRVEKSPTKLNLNSVAQLSSGFKDGPTSFAKNSHLNPGLPKELKRGVESLSGLDMSDVKVHYNSSKPAQINALAYTQGSNIYMSSGQEKHLPHESWHVVQQRQGRVASNVQLQKSPTNENNKLAINNDPVLEREADIMGAKAASLASSEEHYSERTVNNGISSGTPSSATQLKKLPVASIGNQIIQCLYKDEAILFEKNLGNYLFTHNKSTSAAAGGLNKMKQVMGVTADRNKAAEVFGGDDPRYPGNVGKDVDRVIDAVDHGNLREKMTAFYNAALGPFKTMISDRINGANWQQSKEDLKAKGISLQGINDIAARKTQIDNVKSRSAIKYKVLSDKKIEQLSDLYLPAGDPFLRDSEDELYKAQSISKSKQPRTEAFDLEVPELAKLTLTGLTEFNFQVSDLKGDHGASFGNFFATSTFLTIKDTLSKFHGESDTGKKRQLFSQLSNATWKWIKDNKKDAPSLALESKGEKDKRASIEALSKALARVYSSSERKSSDLGAAALSSREKKFILEKLPSYNSEQDETRPAQFDAEKKLPWEEGGTRYKPNLSNSWIKNAVEVLKMPVVSGPSGTTDRMFQAIKYLGVWNNPVVPVDFRMSLLGWMLTSRDHSFHEIMAVAKTYGLAYEGGPDCYKNITPMAEDELRNNVCNSPGYERLFPDEVQYHKSIDNDNSLLYGPVKDTLDQKTQHNPLIESQTGKNLAAYNDSELPKMFRNVTAYTTTAYQIQNIVANDGKFVATQKISHLINGAKSKANIVEAFTYYYVDRKDPAALSAKKKEAYKQAFVQFSGLSFGLQHMVRVVSFNPEVTADALYEESLEHNKQTDAAMKKLPRYQGKAYRGEAYLKNPYSEGKSFNIDKFWSASKKDSFADNYAKKARGITKDQRGQEQTSIQTPLLSGVVLEIDASDAKEVSAITVNEKDDVKSMAVNPRLDEVVFLPGARFQVDKAAEKVAKFENPVVKLKQI